MCFFRVFLWSESATTLRQDWTNTCVLEPCKNDASEREERKSPNPGKRNAKRSVRVYAANCDCVTCLSKLFYTPPTPIRYFQGFEGDGVHKIWAHNWAFRHSALFGGSSFLLTVGAFLLIVELLCSVCE